MSREDLFRAARDKLRTYPGTLLDPRALDKPGSTLQLAALIASAMAEEVDGRASAREAALVVATARDTDLDRDVLEATFQRLPRRGAAAATFEVQVSRPASATAPAGFLEPGTEMLAGGFSWTLDPPGLVWALGQKTAQTATFTCKTLGVAGNVAPAGIQGFKTPSALFDPSFVITKTAAGDGYATGGAERETDSEYKARRAIWDAGLDRDIDFLAAQARGVDGITYAVAIEDLGAGGNPTGIVTLYVGDVNGRANAGLVKRVLAKSRSFRLVGQDLRVVGAVPSLVTLVLRFAVTSTSDIAQVQANARAAVVAYVNTLAPGATLERAAIKAVLLGVAGVVFESGYPYGLVTVNGAAPVDLAAASPSTIFRTSSELVTFG